MSAGGRVWAVATINFADVRAGDRLHVDPLSRYVVENELFERGYLELEQGKPAKKAKAAKAKDAAGDDAGEGEREAEAAPEPSGE